MTAGSGQTSHTRVAAALRTMIETGELQPGDQLPTQEELTAEHGVSRTVIRQAMATLSAEGLIDRVRGGGTYVRVKRPVFHISATYVTQQGDEPRATWTTEAAKHGLVGTQTITYVGETIANDEIASLLGIAPDSSIYTRKRIMEINGDPVQFADSYYPYHIAHGTELARTAKLRGGTIASLERLGYQLGNCHEIVRARPATDDEKRMLQLKDGVPVLVQRRTTYTTDGIPVEVSVSVLAGDRHEMHYTLPAHA